MVLIDVIVDSILLQSLSTTGRWLLTDKCTYRF